MKHILSLILIAILVACGSGVQPVQVNGAYIEEDSSVLRVAVMPTLDCLPIFLAHEHGMFELQDVKVVLCPYQAQMDQDTAMTEGRVELMMTDLVRAERLQRLGWPLYYLTATNLSWQLYTSKMARIKRFEQLDDKMLSMTRYSATALLADIAIDSAKLSSERVFLIQVNDVGIRLNMLETGIMDALLLPEPQATRAKQLGSFMLLDSRNLDIQLGVLAVRKSVMDDSLRHSQINAFMKAYSTACDSINKYGVRHYSKLITQYCNVKDETTDSLPNDIVFIANKPPRQQDIDRARNWLNKH